MIPSRLGEPENLCPFLGTELEGLLESGKREREGGGDVALLDFGDLSNVQDHHVLGEAKRCWKGESARVIEGEKRGYEAAERGRREGEVEAHRTARSSFADVPHLLKSYRTLLSPIPLEVLHRSKLALGSDLVRRRLASDRS